MISYRCGQCADCQRQNANEWYYRAVYEFKSCIKSSGYMLFDTLTYKRAPRISDFYAIPRSLDFMCFSHSDTTNFLKRLRINLFRLGYDVKDNLRYFLSTEYGTDDRYSHRPHVHILFYVYHNCVPYDVLSLAISQSWALGRTDGIPYRSKQYVRDNNVITGGVASSTRVCKYVSKYVMKDSVFSKVIEKRINAILWNNYQKDVRFSVTAKDFDTGFACSLSENRDYDSFCTWTNSPAGKSERRAIKRVVDQYHRQSQGFGLYALQEINYDELIKTGSLVIPDTNSNGFVLRIPLPTYYNRKLHYECTTFNGAKFWQLNAKGKRYRAKRLGYLQQYIQQRFDDYNSNNDIKVDSSLLTRYILYHRGRLQMVSQPLSNDVTIDDKKLLPNKFYNYTTNSDYSHYHIRGVTGQWLGNSQVGYSSFGSFISSSDFISRYVYMDSQYEAQLSLVEAYERQKGEKNNQVKEHKDKLTSLYKMLFPSHV